jgi:selenocysteine lyase/cysteine desulfurase
MLDVKKIRADFPILSRKVNGQDLVYFDNAATSQTPQQVIDVIVDYYSRLNSARRQPTPTKRHGLKFKNILMLRSLTKSFSLQELQKVSI